MRTIGVVAATTPHEQVLAMQDMMAKCLDGVPNIFHKSTLTEVALTHMKHM